MSSVFSMPQWTIVDLNGGAQPVYVQNDDERENDCNTSQGGGALINVYVCLIL